MTIQLNTYMSSSFTIIASICLGLGFSMPAYCQDSLSARYDVRIDALLSMIAEYPKKEQSIRHKIESELPSFIDMFILDKDIMYLQWGYDKSLLSAKVYSSERQKLYTLFGEDELEIETWNSYLDSIYITPVPTTNDSLWTYNLSEKDAIPLTISLSNPLLADSVVHTTMNNHPEAAILAEYKVFPIEFIFGEPKTIMSFNFKRTLTTPLFSSISEYHLFLDTIHKRKTRREFLSRTMN